MALSRDALEIIAPYFRAGFFKRVVSFGFPILPMPAETVFHKLGVSNKDVFLDDSKAQKAKSVHGINGVHRLVDPVKLFETVGAEFVVLDIKQHYGMEIPFDLNIPPNESMSESLGHFDLVIDPGTLEHVFHASTALCTMYNFAKQGGFLLHIGCPVAPNHGLWNPQEKLFIRFYQSNDAHIIKMVKREHTTGEEIPVTERRKKEALLRETRLTTFVEKRTPSTHVINLPKDY